MTRLSPAFALTLFLTAPEVVYAQARPATQTFTCAALKAFVARAGNVVLGSSEYTYEMVHRDGSACQQDETNAPAYEPTSDVSACFVGWRCKQRDSNNGVG